MKNQIAVIIGYPLGHTLSPAMHNAAYEYLDLPCQYTTLEVAPNKLKAALEQLRDPEVMGFNVTIPHKEAILPLLDDVVDLAETIGAVNTVKNDQGTLIGYNTDAPGFLEALKEDAKFAPRGKKVVVLGAGGASRAVTTILAQSKIKELVITDVLPQKAEELAEYLRLDYGIPVVALEAGDPILQKHINEASLLVNTTPIGMKPKIEACPISNDIELHKSLTVYDLVYNPRQTKLLKKAKAAKANTISGLGMLIRQGALAFEIFTGQSAPVEIMRQAAENPDS